MDVQARGKYLPISPQKIRLVCDEVRGMDAFQASDILAHMPKKGAVMLLKVLRSAMANAENNFELDPSEMYVSQVYADDGPRRPGRRFGARGRFKPLIRRTSHLTVILSEREEVMAAESVEDAVADEQEES